MAITSQIRPRPAFGEFLVGEWKKAGLIAPSAVKPVLATIEKGLVLKRLGQLQPPDIARCGRASARSSADCTAAHSHGTAFDGALAFTALAAASTSVASAAPASGLPERQAPAPMA